MMILSTIGSWAFIAWGLGAIAFFILRATPEGDD